jgi:hypothetical protein
LLAYRPLKQNLEDIAVTGKHNHQDDVVQVSSSDGEEHVQPESFYSLEDLCELDNTARILLISADDTLLAIELGAC